jgi:hypothetical protein
MEIAVETFRKPTKNAPSEVVGISKVTVDEAAYRTLEKLEERLTASEKDEMTVATDEGSPALETPEALNDLRDTRIRLFLDDNNAAHFHVTARLQQDNSLIYTEPTMIRLVAM